MASWHYSRRILAWSITASLATVAASTAMAQDAAVTKPADTSAETNPDGTPKVTKLNEIKDGGHWATLADPEGNEFDVIDG